MTACDRSQKGYWDVVSLLQLKSAQHLRSQVDSDNWTDVYLLQRHTVLCTNSFRRLELIRDHVQADQLATDLALLTYRNVKIPLLPPSLGGRRKRMAKNFSRSSEVFLVDNFR